jgi:A nuclease of the HNH/ENDO VII superfamily with conserved WHH
LIKPGTVLKDLLQTAGRKSVAAIDAVIDFIATLARKLKNGAVKLFEDFKQFIDDVFKWLEELFGITKKSDSVIDDALKKIGMKIEDLPKNPYGIAESEKKLVLIIKKLSKNKTAFNPEKVALKDLGIKLPKSKNGLSVDFANTEYLYKTVGEEKNILTIKLTGDEVLDKKLANELAGLKRKPDDYTWHHLDDYNPNKGTCTMQLVDSKILQKTYPHYGAVKMIEDFLGIIYKNR